MSWTHGHGLQGARCAGFFLLFAHGIRVIRFGRGHRRHLHLDGACPGVGDRPRGGVSAGAIRLMMDLSQTELGKHLAQQPLLHEGIKRFGVGGVGPQGLDEILDQREVGAVLELQDELPQAFQHPLAAHLFHQHEEDPAAPVVDECGVAGPGTVHLVQRAFPVWIPLLHILALELGHQRAAGFHAPHLLHQHRGRIVGHAFGKHIATRSLAWREDVAPPLVRRLVRHDEIHRVRFAFFRLQGQKADRLAEGDVAGEALGIARQTGELGQPQRLPRVGVKPCAVMLAGGIQNLRHALRVEGVLSVMENGGFLAPGLHQVGRPTHNVEKTDRFGGFPHGGLAANRGGLWARFADTVNGPVFRGGDGHLHAGSPGRPEFGIDPLSVMVVGILPGFRLVLLLQANPVHEADQRHERTIEAGQYHPGRQHKLARTRLGFAPPAGKGALQIKTHPAGGVRREGLCRAHHHQPRPVLDGGPAIALDRFHRLDFCTIHRPAFHAQVGAQSQGNRIHVSLAAVAQYILALHPEGSTFRVQVHRRVHLVQRGEGRVLPSGDILFPIVLGQADCGATLGSAPHGEKHTAGNQQSRNRQAQDWQR